MTKPHSYGLRLSPIVLGLALSACAGDAPSHTSTQSTELATLDDDVPRDATDEAMGEPWLSPGVPPPHQERKDTPNVALMSDDALWELIDAADPAEHRVLIALKRPGTNRGSFRGEVLLSERDLRNLKAETLGAVRGLTELKGAPIELASGASLPIIRGSIAGRDTLRAIRELPFVDYVEPEKSVFDLFACGPDPYNPPPHIAAEDSGGNGTDLIPYPYRRHAVQEAWSRLGLPGLGERIAILDSGVSSQQEQFFSRYEWNYDTRRGDHARLNFTPFDPDDQCFHGTKVASVAAAPLDGRSIAGVAWHSALTTSKVSYSPLLKEGEIPYVCDALRDAAQAGELAPRVVAMAIGLPYFSSTLAQCIEDAWRTAPNTLFVAAAGSIVPFVSFPANFEPFVTAVSMLEIVQGQPGYRLMSRPGTVGYGPEVDFVSASYFYGIPASGRVGNDTVDEIVTFKMSSASTGIHAGLFALAGQHATRQRYSRAQILQVLTRSASRAGITDFSGEPLESIVGAGIIDALKATGGAREAVIHGPYEVEGGQTVTLEAETDAVVPSDASGTPLRPNYYKYYWEVNGVFAGDQRVLSFQASAQGNDVVRLGVIDTIEAKTLHASRSLKISAHVPPPVTRELYWTSFVSDWATFFNGGRHDRVVNAGVLMPAGCSVLDVKGLLICGDLRPCAGQTPVSSVVASGAGFTVSRPDGLSADSLEALVHQWHDGFNAVRTKVVYTVSQPAGLDCAVPGVLSDTP